MARSRLFSSALPRHSLKLMRTASAGSSSAARTDGGRISAPIVASDTRNVLDSVTVILLLGLPRGMRPSSNLAPAPRRNSTWHEALRSYYVRPRTAVSRDGRGGYNDATVAG